MSLEEIREISRAEFRATLKKLKSCKSLGPNQIIEEMLKAGGTGLEVALCALFNKWRKKKSQRLDKTPRSFFYLRRETQPTLQITGQSVYLIISLLYILYKDKNSYKPSHQQTSFNQLNRLDLRRVNSIIDHL